MDWLAYGYIGLFAGTFLAATLIPFSSEVIFGGFILIEPTWQNTLICVIVATWGNFLGGLTGFYIGYLGKWEWLEKYLRIRPSRVRLLRPTVQRYGLSLAFFTWLPFIGDLLCVVLGFIKVNAYAAAAAMFVGKGVRYALLGYLFYLYGENWWSALSHWWNSLL